MRTVEGFADANGKPCSILVVLKGGEEALKEYSKDQEAISGSISQCFVLTAPGDVISVDITADANTADVFDLEVDGILRASIASKALAKAFHGTINKVCYKGKSGNKRDGAKYCGMQVKRRDTSMDATFSRDGAPSAVSSLVIKAWRVNQSPRIEEATETTPKTPQVPLYEEHASWHELKRCISKEGPQPPFEIDFTDQTKLGKRQKDKMDEIHKRKPKDYSLVATFVFFLQSTTNLTALGFEDVPTYTPIPPPAKPPRVKKAPKAKKFEVDGDADDEDKPEDDGASIIEVAEEERPVVSKPKPESTLKSEPKRSASESKQKSKPKAPLPDYGIPKTAIEIVDGLSKSKTKAKSEKTDSENGGSYSKKETGKSLNFSRSEMFSTENGVTTGDSESLREPVAEEAPASATSLAKKSESATSDEIPNSSTTPAEPILLEDENLTEGYHVEARVEEYDNLSTATLRKGLVLHGEKGNPAHRAFLVRADTQETESHIESQADPSETMLVENNPIKEQSASLPSEPNPETLTRQASEGLVLMGSGLVKTVVHEDLVDSPEYEPLTPPVSAKKPVPDRDLGTIIANRLIVVAQTLSPDQLSQFSQPFSQATTASIQGESHQSGVPSVNNQAHPFNQTIKVLDDSPMQASRFIRASSPAFSEATEVADPMEIIESVRNSQRSSNSSREFQFQYPENLSFHPGDESKNAYHTIASPILGSMKTTENLSMLDIKSTDIRGQARESWKHKSSTPTPTSSFTCPQTPNQNRGQHKHSQSFDEPRPLTKSQMEKPRLLSMSKIQSAAAEKRKADAISETKEAKTEEPRKTTIAPAGRKTDSIEEKRLAAEAVIAALEEEQRQLEEEWNAALVIKKKNDEVAALNRKVEEMKRSNAKKRAEIDAVKASVLDVPL